MSVQDQPQAPLSIHATLAEIIGRWTVGQEDCATPIANLTFFRRESLTEPCACLVEASVILVAQGAKQLLIGERAYPYDTERFLLASLDLPANSQVLQASRETPCLGLALRLDLRVIAELIAQVRLPASRERMREGSAALGTITPALLEPFGRLLALLDEPDVVPVLAPLIEREIHYRLLMSDQAVRLLQIASVGSQSHRIARAIDWLKTHYAEPLRIDELAGHVQMSPSSLHHHFRQLTAMSPLQYQKWLRLNEARRLMLNEYLDAAGAAFTVGYESPSQFSREYGRLFGAPPKRDIDGMRARTAGNTSRLGAV
ncbi:AraC family transcriptional regulator N-terminal domain-containing protein [Afifella sp. YEN Y35]|uniref:AraC family transcriptional regulator n=1 Tax=Afifella sp. YEN Y35 TaxID=3388337 RepID=UPI0039E1501A